MSRYSQETVINASPEAIFAYVADMTKHREWGSFNLEVRQTSSGPAGVGSTYASTAKQFGTQRETQTVTEYSPSNRFAFEAKGGLGLASHIFELTPVDGGTRVTKSMELVKPSFLARIMTMKINRDQPKSLAEDLRRIKAKLEP